MKFTSEKNVVLTCCKKVGGIVGKGVIPLLSNILFETDKEKGLVTVTSTNLEMRLECQFEAKVEFDGKTTIPGRKLISVLSAMTGTEVSFDTNDQHHTAIKCGKAKVKLLGMAPDEFPAKEDFTAKCMVSLSMDQLQTAIKNGSYFVSTDNSRKTLCGIFAEFEENNCVIVSTNGKSLAYSSITLEKPIIAEEKSSAIIPVAAINALLANAKADTVNIGFDDKKFMAWAGDFVVYSKLIEGNYPNYKQFLKDHYTHTAVLPVAETIAKLNLLNAVVSADNPTVDLTISGNAVKLQSESAASGAVADEMELFSGIEGEEFTITLNPTLLLQSFDAHRNEEKVTLNFDEVQKPVEFKFENSIAIIMPIIRKAPEA